MCVCVLCVYVLTKHNFSRTAHSRHTRSQHRDVHSRVILLAATALHEKGFKQRFRLHFGEQFRQLTFKSLFLLVHQFVRRVQEEEQFVHDSIRKIYDLLCGKLKILDVLQTFLLYWGALQLHNIYNR